MSLAIYGGFFEKGEKGDFCEGSEANIIFGFLKSIFFFCGLCDNFLNF